MLKIFQLPKIVLYVRTYLWVTIWYRYHWYHQGPFTIRNSSHIKMRSSSLSLYSTIIDKSRNFQIAKARLLGGKTFFFENYQQLQNNFCTFVPCCVWNGTKLKNRNKKQEIQMVSKMEYGRYENVQEFVYIIEEKEHII